MWCQFFKSHKEFKKGGRWNVGHSFLFEIMVLITSRLAFCILFLGESLAGGRLLARNGFVSRLRGIWCCSSGSYLIIPFYLWEAFLLHSFLFLREVPSSGYTFNHRNWQNYIIFSLLLLIWTIIDWSIGINVSLLDTIPMKGNNRFSCPCKISRIEYDSSSNGFFGDE